MKPLFISFITVITAFSSFTADAQVGWKWGVDGIGNIESWMVTTDASSNVFTAGYTERENSTQFGTITVYDSSNSQQLIVTKADSSGHYLWVVGTQHSDAQPLGMVTNAAGELYLLAWYDDSVCTIGDFTLVNPVTPVPFTGSDNAYFLAKLSAAGNVLWAKNIGAAGMGVFLNFGGGGIGMDGAENIYITGVYNLPVTTIGTTVLYNTEPGPPPAEDVFIAKYDAMGNPVWAKGFGGSLDAIPYGIAVTNSGNFYIPGAFTEYTYINIEGTHLTDSTNYLAKFDNNGNLIWAKNIISSSLNIFSATTDTFENLYMAGSVSQSISIGSDTFLYAGSQDAFIAKYDSSGNPAWARSAGGTHSDAANSIAKDAYGNLWISGIMGSGPGPGYTMNFSGHTLDIIPGSLAPMFIAEYDNCGNYLTSMTLKEGGSSFNAITADSRDNIYISSDFHSDTLVFGSDSLYPIPAGNSLFTAKYKYDPAVHFPSFTNGASQTVTVCKNTISVNIDSFLAVSTGDTGIALTWSIVSPPAHGIVTAPFSAFLSGGTTIPSGLTYSPAAGYYGADSFRIKVSECMESATTTVYVSIDTSISCAENVATASAIPTTLHVYPNPNDGTFTILISSAVKEQEGVTITNVVGEKVKEFTIVTNQTSEVKLEQPSGIYFLSVATANGRYVAKVMIE